MKKVIIGVLTGAALFGGGTFVAAESIESGVLSFEEMQPYIEKMHPGFSVEEQEAMFKKCHGEDGEESVSPAMMNNF